MVDTDNLYKLSKPQSATVELKPTQRNAKQGRKAEVCQQQSACQDFCSFPQERGFTLGTVESVDVAPIQPYLLILIYNSQMPGRSTQRKDFFPRDQSK